MPRPTNHILPWLRMVVLFSIFAVQGVSLLAASHTVADAPETKKASVESSSSAETKKSESTSDEKPKSSEASANEKPDAKSDSSDSVKAEKKSKANKKKKREPHQVERKPLKIEAELSGIFVADQMEEIILRPEVWTQFKVLEAVDHGAQVKKGDVLIRFDDEKLLKQLADESLDQQLGQLALMREEEEFPRTKRLIEIRYEEAKRSYEQAKEDFAYYQSTDRPFAVEITHYRYKSAQEDLASQREELDQLKKMYEADELTEETEKIVLRRQEFQVARAELNMELATADRDYTLEVSLPRADEYYKTALEEAEIRFQQAKTAKETDLPRKTYELEKKRKTRAKRVERHAKLVADQALMELRAPCDGIVYYGKCSAGKWSQIASLQAKLKPFGSVSANSVLMTILEQRPLHVEAKLSEKELPDFREGLDAVVRPVSDDELEFSGKVSKLASVPGAGNKFDVRLSFEHEDLPDWLAAGMTCKASVTVYENEKAIVIPSDLVQSDEDDEKKKYVLLVDSDEEEPTRRDVKLGRKKEKLVEVLKGLDEGDQIVKKEKKSDKKK